MQRFAAVIMRLREPKTTALVFKSGKVRGIDQRICMRGPTTRRARQMVVTGAKSPAMAQKAARTFAKLIGKHGFKVKVGSACARHLCTSAQRGAMLPSRR